MAERLTAASLPFFPKRAPRVLAKDGPQRLTNAKGLHPIILYVVVQKVLEHLAMHAGASREVTCMRKTIV